MATNDGGATPANRMKIILAQIIPNTKFEAFHSPIKVPSQNAIKGTSTIGAAIFINQFGKNGVILKNII